MVVVHLLLNLYQVARNRDRFRDFFGTKCLFKAGSGTLFWYQFNTGSADTIENMEKSLIIIIIMVISIITIIIIMVISIMMMG